MTEQRLVIGQSFTTFVRHDNEGKTTLPELMDWYRNVKLKACKCVTCQKDQRNKKHKARIEPNAELHHLDPKEKCGTVSRLIHYKEHPGAIMDEMLKCIPLCSKHHVDYHRKENKGDPSINVKYNFTENPYYQRRIRQFHENVFMFAPKKLKNDYVEWLLAKQDIVENKSGKVLQGQKPITVVGISQ